MLLRFRNINNRRASQIAKNWHASERTANMYRPLRRGSLFRPFLQNTSGLLKKLGKAEGQQYPFVGTNLGTDRTYLVFRLTMRHRTCVAAYRKNRQRGQLFLFQFPNPPAGIAAPVPVGSAPELSHTRTEPQPSCPACGTNPRGRNAPGSNLPVRHVPTPFPFRNYPTTFVTSGPRFSRTDEFSDL